MLIPLSVITFTLAQSRCHGGNKSEHTSCFFQCLSSKRQCALRLSRDPSLPFENSQWKLFGSFVIYNFSPHHHPSNLGLWKGRCKRHSVVLTSLGLGLWPKPNNRQIVHILQGFHFKFYHGGMPPPPTGGGIWWCWGWGGDLAVNTINLKSTKL